MPKRIKQVKHYSQRNHLKKARSANKKINNEDSNIPSLSIIDTNTIDSATINTPIATQTENIVNTIVTQTEFTINTVATQTENIVNTVATQTEFFVNIVVTQTEVITIQSDEIQTNKLNSKVQLLNLFNQITQILTYNQ
ncbi:10340_t:CDS:1, partial [Dentiscutata heterogama]